MNFAYEVISEEQYKKELKERNKQRWIKFDFSGEDVGAKLGVFEDAAYIHFFDFPGKLISIPWEWILKIKFSEKINQQELYDKIKDKKVNWDSVLNEIGMPYEFMDEAYEVTKNMVIKGRKDLIEKMLREKGQPAENA